MDDILDFEIKKKILLIKEKSFRKIENVCKGLILTGKDEYDSKYDSKIIEDIDDIYDEFTLYNSNFKSSVLY